jgi:hypothetical protein
VAASGPVPVPGGVAVPGGVPVVPGGVVVPGGGVVPGGVPVVPGGVAVPEAPDSAAFSVAMSAPGGPGLAMRRPMSRLRTANRRPVRGR